MQLYYIEKEEIERGGERGTADFHCELSPLSVCDCSFILVSKLFCYEVAEAESSGPVSKANQHRWLV